MARKVQINMSNKSFYSLIVFGVLVLLCIGVYAYGTSNPSVMGHSAGELEIAWNDISEIPVGFADGVDDEGEVGESVSDGYSEKYWNLDEDVYGTPAYKGCNNIYDSQDTCESDRSSRYVCPPSTIKTCYDIYGGPGTSGSCPDIQYYEVSVTCKAVKILVK